MKYIKNTKQVFDRAVDFGWVLKNPIKGFKCTYDQPIKELPGIDSLLTIINADFSSHPNWDIARDGFVMMCFTGYAYETLDRLSINNLKIGIDGKRWLYLKRSKSGEPETLPLLPIVEQIIEKYNNHPCRVISGKLIPVYSNQYFNRLIKEICEELDIDLKLTAHFGPSYLCDHYCLGPWSRSKSFNKEC